METNRVVKFAVLTAHPRISKDFHRLNNHQINELCGFVIKHKYVSEEEYRNAVKNYVRNRRIGWKPIFKVLIACKKLD